jgi:hypothetical protein
MERKTLLRRQRRWAESVCLTIGVHWRGLVKTAMNLQVP